MGRLVRLFGRKGINKETSSSRCKPLFFSLFFFSFFLFFFFFFFFAGAGGGEEGGAEGGYGVCGREVTTFMWLLRTIPV